MTSKMSPGIIAGLGSLALLLGAFGFQYLGGLAPCVLCLYQRWPHAVAILMAILGVRLKSVAVPIMGALSSATSAAIGAYHSGVELGVLKGPTSCSGGVDLSRLSPEAALESIMRAPVVSCDEVVWQLAGLSMASWNVITSTFLTAIWIVQISKMSKKTKAEVDDA